MDIDNNNKPEIIIGSYDGFVYALEGEGSFVLDYVPGISSITQQSGHYSEMITKEPGNFYGKLLYKYNADSTVTGCTALLNDNRGVLITTSTKKLDKLIYTQSK